MLVTLDFQNIARIAFCVQKELAFCVNNARVFLKHYIKMVSSTCNGVLMLFNTQCFYTSLTHFFLCFHTSHLYLHALVTFLKFYHACILVHHGVSGRFTKRKNCAGETRRWECRKDPRRCDEFRSHRLSFEARPFLCMEATITKYVHVYRSVFDIWV